MNGSIATLTYLELAGVNMYTVRQLSIEFVTWHIVETVKNKHLKHDIHTSDYHRLLTFSHNKIHRVSSQLIIHRIIQFVVSSLFASSMVT